MLSGGLSQAPQSAIPGLACCLEHNIMSRENPSSGKGILVLLVWRDMGEQCLKKEWREMDLQSEQPWNLPRWTCIQPVTTETLVPKEQLFQEFEPKRAENCL